MQNWSSIFKDHELDKLSYDEVVDILTKSIDKKMYGSSVRSKVKKLLKYMKDDDMNFKRSYPRK